MENNIKFKQDILKNLSSKSFDYFSIYEKYKREFIDNCDSILIENEDNFLKKFYNKMHLIFNDIYDEDIYDNKDFQIIKNDEKSNISQKNQEIIKEENKNISKEEIHINPIKKPKIIQEKPENLKVTFLKYITINSKNEITKEFIIEKFEKVSSISEKINLIFETIIPNIKKIDISNMLSLIEMFIECYIEKDINNISKIIVNFIENINLELNNLLKNKSKFRVTKDYKNFTVEYLNKNSCAFSFITFSLLLLSQHSNDLSEISKFLLKLALNNNNNNLNKICNYINKFFINIKNDDKKNSIRENYYSNNLNIKQIKILSSKNSFNQKENKNNYKSRILLKKNNSSLNFHFPIKLKIKN
jgi:hypothetical protein